MIRILQIIKRSRRSQHESTSVRNSRKGAKLEMLQSSPTLGEFAPGSAHLLEIGSSLAGIGPRSVDFTLDLVESGPELAGRRVRIPQSRPTVQVWEIWAIRVMSQTQRSGKRAI